MFIRDMEPDYSSSSGGFAKLPVIRRFCEEDLDNCWAYYKSYLVDTLNGDYDLEIAREDLGGLIGSEFDLRSKNGV